MCIVSRTLQQMLDFTNLHAVRSANFKPHDSIEAVKLQVLHQCAERFDGLDALQPLHRHCGTPCLRVSHGAQELGQWKMKSRTHMTSPEDHVIFPETGLVDDPDCFSSSEHVAELDEARLRRSSTGAANEVG